MNISVKRLPRVGEKTIAKTSSKAPEPAKEFGPDDIPILSDIYHAVAPNIYRAGARAVEGTLGIPGSIESLGRLGLSKISSVSPESVLPTPSDVRRTVTEPFEEWAGVPEHFRKPRNTLEEIADQVFTALPSTVIAGGASLPRIAAQLPRLFAGETAAKGAEKAGFGALGQFAASVLGGAGYDTLRRTGFKGIRNAGEKLRKESYAQAEQHLPSKPVDATDLYKNLHDKAQKLKTASGLEAAGEREVGRQLDRVKNAMHIKNWGEKIPSMPVIQPKKAWDLKRHFNSLIEGLDPQKDAAKIRVYRGIVNDLKNDVLTPLSERVPQFGVPYNRAENLHVGLRGGNKLVKMIENNVDISKLVSKNPISATLLGGGALYLGPGKALTGAATALASRSGARAYQFYGHSSEARKLLKDMTTAALEDNKHAVAGYLQKFNKLADEYQSPEEAALPDLGISVKRLT